MWVFGYFKTSRQLDIIFETISNPLNLGLMTCFPTYQFYTRSLTKFYLKHSLYLKGINISYGICYFSYYWEKY